MDLGILDVMQIFGRAGRPQFDKSGEGIIMTTHDKVRMEEGTHANTQKIPSYAYTLVYTWLKQSDTKTKTKAKTTKYKNKANKNKNININISKIK